MLYHAYQSHTDILSLLRMFAQHQSALLWFSHTEGSALRKISAALDVFARMRLTHSRPAYGIKSIRVGEQDVPVVEEETLTLPFGTLLRFRKTGVTGQPSDMRLISP